MAVPTDLTQITRSEMLVLVPLIACAIGAGAAALMGFIPANRRLPTVIAGWVLAVAPLSAFAVLLACVPEVSAGTALISEFQWMPSLGMTASLYLDSLSTLFGLLITGIGTLIVLYTGYYFKTDAGAWRFFCYILLFMTSMLGLVLAGDIMTLFVFWEGTSITSFLLIAYKFKEPAARAGAFKSLIITGCGGIALLAGLLMVQAVVGAGDFATILASGDILRDSPWYGVILFALALGAFTKSAQTPFHVWLPDAMSAPTPASAYLHSATMVKGGIYLMARVKPVMGETEAWFWVLGIFGLVTMVIGAYLALKQYDLKALLAYTTVCQLGAMIMLLAPDTAIAAKALIVGIVAHALYKCALFLVAGIVDHETGTRDLRRLGGLGRNMWLTFGVALVAALSMAGLPPLFGFLAKETLLETVVDPMSPGLLGVIFPAAAVFAGALMVAAAAILIIDTFLGRPRDPDLPFHHHPHPVPIGMLLGPGVPAVLGLIVGIGAQQIGLIPLMADAAARSLGAPVPIDLRLWHGITPPLILSGVALLVGAVIFLQRTPLRGIQERLMRGVFESVYTGTLWIIDSAAWLATRTQNGNLRMYLAIILLSLGGLFWMLAPLPWPAAISLPRITDELAFLRAFTLLMAVAAAGVTIVLRQDLLAVLALGASGLGIAVLFALEPAPDLALVMIVVDILTIVILVLALTRLPRMERKRTGGARFRQSGIGVTRDVLITGAAAVVMTAICLTTLTTRPRESAITPFVEATAKELTGAADFVGAILIDYRALDTLIEIAVFAMAGAGVYTLLRFASRKAGDEEDAYGPIILLPDTQGIGGSRVSPFIRVSAYLLLPFAILVAAMHVLFGHDRLGDGFSAGVIISLAVALWYTAYGYHGAKRRLPWLKPPLLIGAGLAVVVLAGISGLAANGAVLSPVDYGERLGLPLPDGLHLTSALLFEIAICIVVLGGASFILDTLGRPREADIESSRNLEQILELERLGRASPYEGMAVVDEEGDVVTEEGEVVAEHREE